MQVHQSSIANGELRRCRAVDDLRPGFAMAWQQMTHHSDWAQAQQQRQKIRVTKHLGMIVCDSVVSAKI
jgi:hypothetical protein